VALLGLLLVLAPARLPAQVQVGISAFGGIYLPTSDLFEGVVPTTDAGNIALKFSQNTAFTFGGRLAVWPTSRIGIEAEAAYALSKVEGDLLVSVGGTVLPVSGDIDAGLFLGSLNLMWAIIRPPLEPLSIYVSGGVGVVSRTGDFYNEIDDKTDIAGVAGLGLKYGVAKGLWIRIDLRDYISSFQEKALGDAALTGGDSKLQNDLLILASLEYFLSAGN
jgi:hypothetical protein